MIYLIDDKKSRQEILGWSNSKFIEFDNILKPVYSYNQILEEGLNVKEKMFSPESLILFHESFFDFVDSSHRKNSLDIRNRLQERSEELNIPLVLFSGSNTTRIKTRNLVSLPVKLLYQNLELFLNSVKNNDTTDKSLKILLYGENFDIEKILQVKKEIWETKFKPSPLLNRKINEFNTLTDKCIDLSITHDPIVLKSLINE